MTSDLSVAQPPANQGYFKKYFLTKMHLTWVGFYDGMDK